MQIPSNPPSSRTLIREDLALAVAQAHGLRMRTANRVIGAFLRAVIEILGRGERLTLPGIGTLTPSVRPSRYYRVAGTTKKVLAPAKSTITFRLSKPLREALKAS